MNRYEYTALAKEKYRDIFLSYVSLVKLEKIIDDYKSSDAEEKVLVYRNLKNLFNELYEYDYFRKEHVSPDRFYTKEVVLTLFISHRLEKLEICASEIDLKKEYLSLSWFQNSYSRWKADGDAYERFRSEMLQVFEMKSSSAAFSDYSPENNPESVEELYNEFFTELSEEYKKYRKKAMGFTSKLNKSDAVEDYMFDAVTEAGYSWDSLFKNHEPYGDEFAEDLLKCAKKEKSYISTLADVYKMKTPAEISSILLKSLADCFDGSDKKPVDYIKRCLLTNEEREKELDYNEDEIIERWIRALLEIAYEQKEIGVWYSSGKPSFKLADLERLVFKDKDPDQISRETIMNEYYNRVVGAEGCAGYVKLFVDDFFSELFSRNDIEKASSILFKKYQKMINNYLPGGPECINQDNRREFSKNEYRIITAMLNELLNREYLLLEGNKKLQNINNLDSLDAVLSKEYFLFNFNELLHKYRIDLTGKDELSVELNSIYTYISEIKSEKYKNKGRTETRDKIADLVEKYPAEDIVAELSEVMKSIRLKAGGKKELAHPYMNYIYNILQNKPITEKFGESLREFLYDSAYAFSGIENGMNSISILDDIFCKAMQMSSVNFRSAEEIVYYNYLEEKKKLAEAKNTIKELKNRSQNNTASYKGKTSSNYTRLIREAVTSDYSASALINAIKDNIDKPDEMSKDNREKTLNSFYNYFNNNFCSAICMSLGDEMGTSADVKLMHSIAKAYLAHRSDYKGECSEFSDQIIKELKYNILPDLTEHPHCLSKPFFFGTDTANDDYVTEYLLKDVCKSDKYKKNSDLEDEKKRLESSITEHNKKMKNSKSGVKAENEKAQDLAHKELDNIKGFIKTVKAKISPLRELMSFYLQECLEDYMHPPLMIKDKELRNKIKAFRIRSCLREVNRESLLFLFAAYYFTKNINNKSMEHFVSCLNGILDICRFEPLNNCLIFDNYIVCIAYLNIVADKQIDFGQMVSSLEEQYFQ